MGGLAKAGRSGQTALAEGGAYSIQKGSIVCKQCQLFVVQPTHILWKIWPRIGLYEILSTVQNDEKI
ncbi:MAG: hypothetical protein A2749_00345 [Parcubacteria group bacterium RIFCSPHIGHO2_01_FULL_45_26]|nr:MAG: hypothetical protein A2749_00345 [Parcubacteria group bacterium RIFCSPHIGHO2_01_FULL_45_26]